MNTEEQTIFDMYKTEKERLEREIADLKADIASYTEELEDKELELDNINQELKDFEE